MSFHIKKTSPSGGGGNVSGSGAVPYVTLWTGTNSVGFSTHLSFYENIGQGQLKVGNALLWQKSNSVNPADMWLGESSGNVTATSATGRNIGIGYFSGSSMTTGSGNTFVGSEAGSQNTSGSSNAFFGSKAGSLNSSGNGNAFFGANAGGSNTADSNSFFGASAGGNNVTGTSNSFFGFQSGVNNDVGDGNTFAGYLSGGSNTNGSNNTFLGSGAGANNISGQNNTFVGYASGLGNITGTKNFYMGENSGLNVEGNDNVALGYQAGLGTSGATFNRTVSLGNYAGQSMHTAGGNVAIGWSAASQYTGGQGIFIGYEAGNALNHTGYSNVIIGYQSGTLNTTGNNNTFIGTIAAQDNTTGSFNTSLGVASGINNTTGSSNVMLGAETGNGGGYNSSIAIGRGVYISRDNQLLFGSSIYPILYAAVGAYSGAGNNLWWEYDDDNERFSNNAHGSNISAQSGKKFALTDGVNTPIFRFVLANGEAVTGAFNFTVTCKDAGGEVQAHSDLVTFSAVMKGGVQTVQITHSNTVDAIATTSGTLAVTYAYSYAAGYLTISANANTSLTPTELNARINIVNVDGTANHSVTFL